MPIDLRSMLESANHTIIRIQIAYISEPDILLVDHNKCPGEVSQCLYRSQILSLKSV